MRRLLVVNNWKGRIKMSPGYAIYRSKRQATARYELPFMLQMSDWPKGETVSTSTVVMALLWQYYGLDLNHPEVSQWLEQNAPDVKYAVAEDQLASGDDRSSFRIGPNCISRWRSMKG
jgi:hypothetical protein